ncbi:unnamed protein product [Mesocestoides corti]|nr:unnamed protein product [Mesocestoides corti]
MKGLQSILFECAHQIGPLFSPDKPKLKTDAKVELKLCHLEQPLTICFSNDTCEFSKNKELLAYDSLKVEEFLRRLSSNAAADFFILSQSLIASLELQVGDLIAFDRLTYTLLLSEALNQIEQTRLTNSCVDEIKPVLINVASFENDFLLVLTRILKAFAVGTGVVVHCASLRLILPLYVFAKLAIVAGAPPYLVNFVPIHKTERHDFMFSSIQMIMRPADLDSAARAIVKASSYHAGMTSWRPSVVLVEQDYEKAFYKKVKNLLSGAPGDCSTLNENSHLSYSCAIPSYLKAEFEDHVKLACNDGGEVVRPSDDAGPVFIFGLTPASAMVEKTKTFPLGPSVIVLPFRTVNEGLKIAKYFGDRERRILGAGEYVSSIPKSATIWTDNSSLSLQVLAKLAGYTALGVNCGVHRLASSFLLAECSSKCPTVRIPGLPALVKGSFTCCNSNLSGDLLKTINSTDALLQTWKKLPFEKRLSAFTSSKDLASILPKLKLLRDDSAALLSPASSHVTLGDQLNCAFSNKLLCLLRKWQEPLGSVNVVLKSGELLPSLQELVISSIVLGNTVILIMPKGVAVNLEVNQFCESVNQLITQCFPTLSKLGPMVQVKQTESSEEEISAALASLPVSGISCLSDANVASDTADVSVEQLCRFTSVFWSVGGDLFAN